MSNKLTDLEVVLKTWAWQNYERTVNWFSRINIESASFEVHWDHVKVNPLEPKYTLVKSNETSQVVFESKYENNTDDDQTNNFRAEKETIASAVIKLTKGFSRDMNVGLDLPVPQNLPEATKAVGSFGTRLYLEGEEGSQVEKKLKWSVDTTIISRKHNITVAKLEVEETHVSYSFSMDVRLKGRVIVNIRNIKDHSVVKTVENDVSTILMDMYNDEMSEELKDAKFDMSKGAVIWPVIGTLTMKYGISQKVNISYSDSSRSHSKGRYPKY